MIKVAGGLAGGGKFVPLEQPAASPTMGSVRLLADDDRVYFSTGEHWEAEGSTCSMILLDTHVVLWWQAGGGRLSRRAGRELARTDTILRSGSRRSG